MNRPLLRLVSLRESVVVRVQVRARVNRLGQRRQTVTTTATALLHQIVHVTQATIANYGAESSNLNALKGITKFNEDETNEMKRKKKTSEPFPNKL